MSGNIPFGFQPPDGGDRDPNNPLAGFDLSNLGSALESLGRMLQAGGDGPVNWDMASQIARSSEPQKSDPGVTDSERSAVTDAVNLANHWLDSSSSFAADTAAAISWSRGEWVDGTIPAWQRIITPVAEHVQGAMAGMMSGEGLPEGIPGIDPTQMQAMMGPLAGMAQQLGAAMFANQVGQALGMLSGEVLSSSDIGVPLTTDGRPTLLPANVNAFADGLGMPRQEVLLYVALRECAHQRLFTHVPWLRSRLEDAVAAYARGIRVDTSQMEEMVGRFDPSDPASMTEMMGNAEMFEMPQTPEQQAALARLETLLALVEGWVDHAVSAAVADRMPGLPQLTEAMRRRRAAGGPAEKTFANLVGLELRPRRLREASQFWARVEADGDLSARDGYWGHPDLMPTAEDLDDLDGFFQRSGAVDLELPTGPAETIEDTHGNATPNPDAGTDDDSPN
ncbi:MAG: zinc-dependent metalloprotease [Candidatus Nanopelagicales bacterium]